MVAPLVSVEYLALAFSQYITRPTSIRLLRTRPTGATFADDQRSIRRRSANAPDARTVYMQRGRLMTTSRAAVYGSSRDLRKDIGAGQTALLPEDHQCAVQESTPDREPKWWIYGEVKAETLRQTRVPTASGFRPQLWLMSALTLTRWTLCKPVGRCSRDMVSAVTAVEGQDRRGQDHYGRERRVFTIPSGWPTTATSKRPLLDHWGENQSGRRQSRHNLDHWFKTN